MGKKRKNKKPRMKPRKIRAKPTPEPEATLEAQTLQMAGIQGPLFKAQAFAGWTSALSDEYRRSFVSLRKKAFTPATLQEWYKLLSQRLCWIRPRTNVPRDEDRGAGRLMPRRACWLTMQRCSCPYEYGGQQSAPMTMPDWFLEITEKVSRACGLEERPNSCNANFYEDGLDSVAWHADDEDLFDSLRNDVLIISLSLGVSRSFELHPQDDPLKVTQLVLENGDLMTMEGLLQKHYRHRVARSKDLTGGRINLTWRWVRRHHKSCQLHR